MVNEIIKFGQVFNEAQLIPYVDGSVNQMELFSTSSMKSIVMSFDTGATLENQVLDGVGMIVVLEGEGYVVYEGEEFTLGKGENFCMKSGVPHTIYADRQFKMALLLFLD